ncbi:unnamed protein product (macronuclear) [Paramecium tetraurelia]|uniref:Cilia- and flagella-associated protein 157 n=1 Tax=Paramecium tetraurelia TaxID=5888 RepID=A0EI76_PARTE|nr:uncharacterized protein GSPATT00027346001 [Paramecium tetraurelia]CAK95017.1 unnamed protein product [Paramecium tetraurelia]|eukprot:XP_001462390.1 hypothetical protein (macronuclear) [Paramecium tetraurelia strain d4-2]
MSKSIKGLNLSQDVLAQELDAQRRDRMKAISTHKNIKDRLDRMEQERDMFGNENFLVKRRLSDDKREFIDLIEFHKKEKEELREEKQKIEYEYGVLQRKMFDIDEDYKKMMDKQRQIFETDKQPLIDKIKFLEARLEKIDGFLQTKADLESEREKLIETLAQERRDKQRELADKEKEKVKETSIEMIMNQIDQLRKEMENKVQETKLSERAQQKEQLETTTRLTVLQNYQMTTELEYQSKQTGKLLGESTKLQEQVTSLKRDIEIHKQVEQELAKRSHFSQKLIKKLSSRIKDLEDQLEQKEFEHQELNSQQARQEMEKIRETEIMQLEKKIAQLQNDNEILRSENNHLLTKLDTIRLDENKFANLSAILASNLEYLKNNFNHDISEIIDLSELRDKSVSQWTSNQKITIMSILLRQTQQYLTKKNLNISDTNQININHTMTENATIVDNNNKSFYFPSTLQLNCLEIKSEEDQTTQLSSKRFQGVPLDISNSIVKSNLRDWGKPSALQQSSQLLRKYKLK